MHVHQRRSSTGIGARVVAGIVMASTLVMGGCVDPVGVAPSPIATPSPTLSSPAFASDEEALAAAEAAYAEYLTMSDLIAQEGGVNPERIAPFVTEQQLAVELDGFSALSSLGRHTTGVSKFGNAELQQWTGDNMSVRVAMYVCSDIRDLKVVESTGEIIRDNSSTQPFLVELSFSATFPSHRDHLLLLERAAPLTESDDC